MKDKEIGETKVLYNAGCPVCSVEINHYARLTGKHDLAISYDDLNAPESLNKWGIDAETAAKRLHVQKNEQVFSGVPAFLILWRLMPGYRWLARLVSLPGVYRLAIWTYDYVLAPALYRWHRWRNRPALKP